MFLISINDDVVRSRSFIGFFFEKKEENEKNDYDDNDEKEID